jgi:GLPGLI family protein
MKKNSLFLVWSIVFLLSHSSKVASQDQLSGTITYQQITRYSFDFILAELGNDPRIKDRLATMPEEGTNVQVLAFNSKKALFKEDDSEKEAISPGLQNHLYYESSLKPPSAVLQEIYYDFEKNQKLEQMEYLTRMFLLKSEIAPLAWKLGSEKKKILEYTCMGATMNMDDQEIVAWFAPELPVSLGPANFGGLPGLVLAVERNGETAYVATSVDLTPPAAESMEKPDKGTKVTQEEFESIKEEKVKEWKESPKPRLID